MLLNFVLVLPAALAFNLDLRFPHVYHHSAGEPEDYFGFNVALHPGSVAPGDQPWMMVGAPKRNNPQFPQTFTRNSGVVTVCPFNETCTTLKFQRGGYLKHHLNGEMFGSVQDVRDGFAVTCAPRWKVYEDQQNQEKYKLFGTCYQAAANNLNNFVNITPLANEIQNLAIKVKTSKGTEHVQPYFLYGEAGFSAHYSQNRRNEKLLVLGAPGIFNWKGSTVLYNMRLNEKQVVPDPVFHNPHLSNDIFPFGFFGYAVTSGRFFYESGIHHVAGAPRSQHIGQVIAYSFPKQSHSKINHHQTLGGPHFGSYFGAALAACDINGDRSDDLMVGAPMFSSQLGEDGQDEGAVFVFLGNWNLRKFNARGDAFLTNPSKIQNGRFGTAISCVGDLDQDGFQDVAISAPYERHADPYDTSGVVYIYSGSQTGLRTTPSQVIRASEIIQERSSRQFNFPPLQGFGFSISRGQDVDGNGYPDVAIGSYISGHAVILRSQPVVSLSVNINHEYESSSSSIARNAKEIHIRICPKYTGQWLPVSLMVTQILEVDSKYNRLKTGSPTSQVEVRHEEHDPDCQRMKLTFHENVQNFLEPIPIKVSYRLPNDSFQSMPVLFTEQAKLQANDFFCSSCPITNVKSNAPEHSMLLHFATDCGSNNICLANLSLDVNFIATNNTKSYVIGSPTPPMLHVSVTNAANSNPAYNARVKIRLPTGATYLPQQCNKDAYEEAEEVDATTIICEIANPLQPGQTRNLQLGLDMSSVSGAQGNLVASVKVFTSSTNRGTVEAVNDTLDLAAVADITVSGKSGKEQYYFDNKEEEDQTEWEIPFDLNYQVEKLGISPVDKVLFSLQVPTFTKKSKKFLQILSSEIYVDERQIVCLDATPEEAAAREKRQVYQPQQNKNPANRTMVVSCGRSEGWICETFSCVLGPFRSTLATARVHLTVRLNTKELESMLGRRDIIVFETNAHVVIKQPNYITQPDNDLSDSAVVTATLIGRVPEGHVEPWVLALSVIGGVLILLLLITGLIKAGFFERKEKKALVELKRKTQMDMDEYQRVSAMQHVDNMDDDDDE